MSPPEFQSGQGSLLQKIEALLDQQVAVADQDALLEVYEQFLHRIWERIMPTLGGVTVLAIVERSLVVTSKQYPGYQHIARFSGGVGFSPVAPAGCWLDIS